MTSPRTHRHPGLVARATGHHAARLVGLRHGGPRNRFGATVLFGFLAFTLITPANADSNRPAAEYADRQLADPAKEAEARTLMAELRCLVCQGQAISDSDAEMAGDMRALVRRRIAAGESAKHVRESLIASYGDYVTYDPPFTALTAPLWLLPLILLGLGAWLSRGLFRRRRG